MAIYCRAFGISHIKLNLNYYNKHFINYIRTTIDYTYTSSSQPE